MQKTYIPCSYREWKSDSPSLSLIYFSAFMFNVLCSLSFPNFYFFQKSILAPLLVLLTLRYMSVNHYTAVVWKIFPSPTEGNLIHEAYSEIKKILVLVSFVCKVRSVPGRTHVGLTALVCSLVRRLAGAVLSTRCCR